MATAVRSVALNLKSKGHDILVLCPDQGDGPNIYDIDGIIVQRFPYKHGLGEISFPARDSKYLSAILPEVLHHFNPDVIWSFWPNFSVALSHRNDLPPYLHIPASAMPVSFDGLLSGVKLGTSSLRFLAGTLLWYIARWRSKAWEHKILRTSVKTVVFSQNVKRQYNYLYPDLTDKVIVVHSGSDVNRFRPLPFQKASSEITAKWGIPEHQRLLLFVGRLSPDKNIYLLLSALKKLRERFPDSYKKTNLLIVGTGKQENALKKYAIENSLNVTFCGFQYEILNKYYSAAWALVLPTIFESFGYVMVEAGLCGTPSVAIKPDPPRVQTAADEIITQGQTGLLVSHPTSDSLCEALHQAISWDFDERVRLGQLSRIKIMGDYNWDNFTKAVLELSV